MNQGEQHRRFITGFNGLRTLGVIGVILYHINPDIFSGGYLGVPIFLVLTGYLITDQILRSISKKSFFDFKDYFIKRFKRLYPALLLMLFGSSAYIVLFQRNFLRDLKAIFVTNILNVYNFWQIENGQSYFERFANNESPFTHMWSLSIQGQFYFLYPILLVLLLKFLSKKKIIGILTCLTIASALLMAMLYKPEADPSRIYYGTDTRIFSLLVGCLLAFWLPAAGLSAKSSASKRLSLNCIGALSLAATLYFMFNMEATSAFTYRGGMFLFSVVVAVLVGVVAHPASSWNKILTNPLFNEIGKISYGLYLYQFPVMIFFESKATNVADHRYLYPFLEVALIFVISYLSYYFVEKPLGDYKWKTVFNKKKLAQRWLVYGSITIITIGGVTGLVQAGSVPPQADADNSPLAKSISANDKQNEQHNKKLLQKSKRTKKNGNMDKQVKLWHKKAKTNPVNKDYQKLGIAQFDLQRGQDLPALAVGDSVMVDGSAGLRQIFPQMVIDAAVSRNTDKAIALLQSYQAQGQIPATVVVGMGTNGPVSVNQIEEIMKAVGSKTNVFWINVYVPTRSWEHPVNDVLSAQSKKFKNLQIINWHDYCQNHSDWFYDDQVHPNAEGSKMYSAFVAKQILKSTKY